MKPFALLTLMLSLALACRFRQPIYSVPPENNKTYTVEYLFEHDGCKVYRFRDMGNFVYFTNCTGESITHPDSSTTIRNRTEWKN